MCFLLPRLLNTHTPSQTHTHTPTPSSHAGPPQMAQHTLVCTSCLPGCVTFIIYASGGSKAQWPLWVRFTVYYLLFSHNASMHGYQQSSFFSSVEYHLSPILIVSLKHDFTRSMSDMPAVTVTCGLLFRFLDAGVREQERRGAPTSALRPGAALIGS